MGYTIQTKFYEMKNFIIICSEFISLINILIKVGGKDECETKAWSI